MILMNVVMLQIHGVCYADLFVSLSSRLVLGVLNSLRKTYHMFIRPINRCLYIMLKYKVFCILVSKRFINIQSKGTNYYICFDFLNFNSARRSCHGLLYKKNCY